MHPAEPTGRTTQPLGHGVRHAARACLPAPVRDGAATHPNTSMSISRTFSVLVLRATKVSPLSTAVAPPAQTKKSSQPMVL
jgi:hypothetical protein